MKCTSLKRQGAIVAVLALAALSAVSVALADNIKNQVTAGVGGDAEVVAGGSVTVPYYVQATGVSCDAADGSSVTVTVNVPTGVTISKPDGSPLGGASQNQLTFSSCGDAATNSQSVKFTPNGQAGTVYTIPTVSWADTSGTYNPATTAFTITVKAAGGGGGGSTPSDTTPPVITPNVDPASPNGNNGWYTGSVSVSFSVVDNESSITSKSVGCDGVTVSSDTTGITFTCTATSAGGTDSKSVTIKRDATPPVISLRAAGDSCSLPGDNGWCRGTQTAGFSAAEATSGLANGEASPFAFTKSTATNGSAVQISSGTLDDNAGNTSNSVNAGPFKIDSVGPSVSVSGVENNGSYTLGSVPAAGCQTSDSLSDVADVATVAVTGGTVNGVGTFTATCSGAKDNAGNAQSAPVSVSYRVVYGGVSGILQPINPDNTSLFNRGRAVPVKFQLAGDPPAFVTSGWTLKRISVNCATLADVGTSPESVESVTPSTVFRYDSEGDQYIYNADFRDKAAGTCWRVQVTLDDGTVMTSAIFKLQK